MRPVYDFALFVLAVCAGCAGPVADAGLRAAPEPEPPAPVVPATETEEPAAVEAEVAEPVPEECASDAGGICTPPSEFIDKLCRKRQPNAVLTMFRKGSPWTRTYVRARNMEAWLVGGRRTSPAKLKLFEEVLIVRDRSAAEGGIKVSGAGSYDVVRWDGTCVSVMSDEVSTQRPPTPEVATIQWKRLDARVRRALTEDKRIAYREEQQREHCDGAKRSQRCEVASARLSDMVAAFIRDGGSVPSATALE